MYFCRIFFPRISVTIISAEFIGRLKVMVKLDSNGLGYRAFNLLSGVENAAAPVGMEEPKPTRKTAMKTNLTI